MKKTTAFWLSFFMLFSVAVFTVGCTAQTSPKEGIYGTWGGRSDNIEATFNDDGTCDIGGVLGTYEVKEDKSLVVTPNGGNAQVFEWTDNTGNDVAAGQWTIHDDKLSMNGHVYNKQKDDSSKNASANSDKDSKGSQGGSSKGGSSQGGSSQGGSSQDGSSQGSSSQGGSSQGGSSQGGSSQGSSSQGGGSGVNAGEDLPNLVEYLD